MTSHYRQLFASQQTVLLLLPPLPGTWLGFGSSAITGAWYRILTKLRLQWYIDSNPPHGDLVLSGVSVCASPNLNILGSKVLQQAHLRRTCLTCLSQNWYFEVGEACLCGHVCVASLLLCICTPNPWVLFSGVGGPLLNVVFCFSSVRCIRLPGFALIRLSYRCVIDVMLLHCVCCTMLIRTLIIVCSVSFHLLLSEFDITQLPLQLIH